MEWQGEAEIVRSKRSVHTKSSGSNYRLGLGPCQIALNLAMMGESMRLCTVRAAVLRTAFLVATLLSLQSHVGDAAIGGFSSAELLQSVAATRPAVHRLRGGELGGGTQVILMRAG